MKLLFLNSLLCLSAVNAVSPTHPKKEEIPQQEPKFFQLERFEVEKDKTFLFLLHASDSYQEFISETCLCESEKVKKTFSDLFYIFLSKKLFNEAVCGLPYIPKTLLEISSQTKFKEKSSLLPKVALQKNDAIKIILSRLKELAAEVSLVIDDNATLSQDLLIHFKSFIKDPYNVQGDQSYFLLTTMLWQSLILPGFEKEGVKIINNPKNQKELEKRLSILGLKSLEFEAKAESSSYAKKSVLDMQGVFYRIFFLKEEDGFGIEGFKIFMQILFDIDESIMQDLKDNSHLLPPELDSRSSSFLSSMLEVFTWKSGYEKLPEKSDPADEPKKEEWRYEYSARQKALLALIEKIYGERVCDKTQIDHVKKVVQTFPSDPVVKKAIDNIYYLEIIFPRQTIIRVITGTYGPNTDNYKIMSYRLIVREKIAENRYLLAQSFYQSTITRVINGNYGPHTDSYKKIVNKLRELDKL